MRFIVYAKIIHLMFLYTNHSSFVVSLLKNCISIILSFRVKTVLLHEINTACDVKYIIIIMATRPRLKNMRYICWCPGTVMPGNSISLIELREPVVGSMSLSAHIPLMNWNINWVIIMELTSIFLDQLTVTSNSPAFGLYKIPAESVSWPPTSFLMS